MRFEVPTIDDAVRRSFEAVGKHGCSAKGTKGQLTELIGVQFELANPRARICMAESRATLFSALGEFLWYLAGSDRLDFIEHYAPRYGEFVKANADGRVSEAYGPRLLNWDGKNQLQGVIQLLRDRPESKQAVLQLFDKDDLTEQHQGVPCTCVVQFLARQGRLHVITMMRSNDAVRGLPHDVFAFTMLQELIARDLGIEVGTYRHWVGSLHIYDADQSIVSNLLGEGWQQTIGSEMPEMPTGNPWPFVEELLKAEHSYRVEDRDEPWPTTQSSYWDGFIWLLETLRHVKKKDLARADAAWTRRPLSVFDSFVSKRIEKIRRES